VELIQYVFEKGEIPKEKAWSVLVLIPKGSGVCRGIGLQEIVWKLVSSIIDRRLKDKIEFRDALHGFRASRGSGTSTIEAKLRMQLSQKEEKTLYMIFIDLKKAYDTLDRE
jgi:pantothenate kinase-related protein Tda10